jgi:2-keto-4-pentenoate hydratase/2-oxohepta-3-ene-1,7-dioic acid hydratase in catechol pathway
MEMRIVRFDHRGKAVYGLVEGESIVPLAAAPWEAGGSAERTGAAVERRSAALLVPVVPSKILCVGRNYRAHAAELGQEVPEKPLIFLKAPSSLLPHRGNVLLPPESSRVDHEGELAVVIGRRGRRLSREEATRAVFGYSCALDITARDLQKTDGQWWRAKGFDTFCPLGPAVETDVDPSDLLLETLVDGVVKQSGRTSEMAFDIPTLVAWASHAMTLMPGDVLLTGTPEGVSPLSPGQIVEVRIGGVGTLSVRVEKEG